MRKYFVNFAALLTFENYDIIEKNEKFYEI